MPGIKTKSRRASVRKVKAHEKPFVRIGKMIRNLRISAGFAQHELADEIDINNSYLSRIENGERRPSTKIMKRMAAVLDTTFEELVQASGLISEEFEIVPREGTGTKVLSSKLDELREILAGMGGLSIPARAGTATPRKVIRRPVPIFDRVPAGFFDEANVVREYDQVEQIVLSEEELQYDDHAFALRVKGDSMIDAGILEDDIVIISPNTRVINGDIAAVTYQGVDITLKKFYREGAVVVLQPCNSVYHPITFSDPEELEVLGKVVLVRRKLI